LNRRDVLTKQGKEDETRKKAYKNIYRRTKRKEGIEYSGQKEE